MANPRLRETLGFCLLFMSGCGGVTLDEPDAAIDGPTCTIEQAACAGTCVDTQRDPLNCGSCGANCTSGACRAGACVRRAFITERVFDANFGGLDAGDAICQSEANDSRLGGSWRAWLGDTSGSPATRFTRGGSFARVDGTKIADDFADLIDGDLDSPITTTARGGTPPTDSCWTGVQRTGGLAQPSAHCANWRSTSQALQGSSSQNNMANTWGGSGSQNCDPSLVAGLPLYCFEQ